MIKYRHFALNNLFLANGYREVRTHNGIEREYEREEELEQCIRQLVLRKPESLRGWDLRFLRRGLGLSQADFGKMIGRDTQTVARYEKSAVSVPKFADLMIRARFAERFMPQIGLAELLSFIDGTAPALPEYIQLSLTQNGWVFNFGSHATISAIKSQSTNSVVLPVGHGPTQNVLYLSSVSPAHDLSIHGKLYYWLGSPSEPVMSTPDVLVPTPHETFYSPSMKGSYNALESKSIN